MQPPPSRPPQPRHIKLGTRGIAEAATPRVVLRNRGTLNLALWGSPKQPPPESSSATASNKPRPSGARQSTPPPSRPPQPRHIKLGNRGLADAATPESSSATATHYTWHSGARRCSHPPAP